MTELQMQIAEMQVESLKREEAAYAETEPTRAMAAELQRTYLEQLLEGKVLLPQQEEWLEQLGEEQSQLFLERLTEAEETGRGQLEAAMVQRGMMPTTTGARAMTEYDVEMQKVREKGLRELQNQLTQTKMGMGQFYAGLATDVYGREMTAGLQKMGMLYGAQPAYQVGATLGGYRQMEANRRLQAAIAQAQSASQLSAAKWGAFGQIAGTGAGLGAMSMMGGGG